MGQGRRAGRIRAASAVLKSVHVRTASVAQLLRQAAPSDNEIAEMLQSTRDRQRTDVAEAVELIIGRPPTSRERDGIWAIASPEVYLLLINGSGWAPDEYEEWIAKALESVVPRS